MLPLRKPKHSYLILFYLQVILCVGSSIDTCSDKIRGYQSTDNVIDFFPGIEDESECLENCKIEPECVFYSHHSATDLNFPNWCFLLSEILEPIWVCDTCRTGPVDCNQSLCGFILSEESNLLESHMFTNVGNTSAHIVSLGKTCDYQLYIWGVGGGGAGGLYAGGGSGHPKDAYYVSDSSKDQDFLITVGGPAQPTFVKNSAGEDVLIGAQGGSAWWQHGGNGYSGGGGGGDFASAGAEGGMDGGNGATWGSAGAGGLGSGVNIHENDLTMFSLSPGQGGNRGGGCDGGGGGVLVNNQGPSQENDRYVGDGYGGGGGSCNGEFYAGLPGTVIIEFVEK